MAGLFETTLVICAVIFLIVATAVVYNVWRFRSCGETSEPRQSHGYKKLEIAWTAIPAAIVLVLLIMTASVMSKTVPDSDPPPKADLTIIAHQWWWEARYAASGARAANEIHIPVGKRWVVQLLSADVIHDFWAPSLGPKMDIVPGHPNCIWVEADQPGEYMGACAEFCGAQHAWMRFTVVAQPEADFNAWQQRQLQPIATNSTAVAGRRVFEQFVCANCHSINGLSTNATAGPDLTHLGGRQTIGAGVISNSFDNLVRWLKDPQAIKPSCLMPSFNLTDQQAGQLALFLEGSP